MLYPNPTTGSITIMPTTISNETFYISVFNLLGVELLTQSLTAGSSIDLSVYRNGIYLVRIVDKEGKEILVRKAILQR